MSPTIILKGCMAMLDDKSKKATVIAPNQRAAREPYPKPKLPEFGSNIMTITATKVPKIRYGNRRPPSFGAQVRSE